MMHKATIFAFVCAIATVASAPALAQSAPPTPDCTLKKLGEIPLTISGNAITAPITLDGASKTMMIELAEGPSYVNDRVGRNLDLTFRDMVSLNWISHWNYFLVQWAAFASKVQFGPISAGRSEFLVIPDPHWQLFDGIVGSGALGVVDYDLDIGGGKITMFDPNHCPGQVVYWTTAEPAIVPMHIDDIGGHFTAAMTLDGKPLHVALRTGGPSYLTLAALRTLLGTRPDPTLLHPVSNDIFQTAGAHIQAFKVYEYPFKSLTAAGITINNPKIYVVDDGNMSNRCSRSPCYNMSDLYLGLPVLSKLRIFVSSRDKTLYITPR